MFKWWGYYCALTLQQFFIATLNASLSAVSCPVHTVVWEKVTKHKHVQLLTTVCKINREENKHLFLLQSMKMKCLFVIVQIIISILKLKGNSKKINYKIYSTLFYLCSIFHRWKKTHTKCSTVKTSVEENTEDKSIKQNTYHANSNWLKVSL